MTSSPYNYRNAPYSILKVSIMPKLSILKVSIRQVKAARALLGWSQEELARAAEVSIPTIKRLEANEGQLGGRSETGDKICEALQQGGVEFIDENGGGAGVRCGSPAKRDQRSSNAWSGDFSNLTYVQSCSDRRKCARNIPR
jgi:transcriptional regulator with XRE-family HTH domain